MYILLALLCHSFKKDSIMDCGGCSSSLPSHEVGRPSPPKKKHPVLFHVLKVVLKSSPHNDYKRWLLLQTSPFSLEAHFPPILSKLHLKILARTLNTEHKSDINYVFSDRIYAEFWLLTSLEREQTRWWQQLKFLQFRKVFFYINGTSRLRNRVFVQTILYKIPRGDMKKE